MRLEYVHQKKIDESVVFVLNSPFDLLTQINKLVPGICSVITDVTFCNALFKLRRPAEKNIFS